MSGRALVFQQRGSLATLEKRPHHFRGRCSCYGHQRKFVCFMDVTRGDGKFFDHVWMPNMDGLEDWNFRVLEPVEFDAVPYEYKNAQGRLCQGLRCAGKVMSLLRPTRAQTRGRISARFISYSMSKNEAYFDDIKVIHGPSIESRITSIPNQGGLEKWRLYPGDHIEFDVNVKTYKDNTGACDVNVECSGTVELLM